VQLLPPEIAGEVDAYRAWRNERFPNWYALQQEYFSKDPAARRAFLRTPDGKRLKQYWDERRAYLKEHPDVAAYYQRFALTGPDGEEIASFRVPEIITNPILMSQVVAHQVAGQPLTAGALAELRRIWLSLGEPGGSMEGFIESIPISDQTTVAP